MKGELPPQPSWGWRLRCQEPGCECVTYGWAKLIEEGGHYSLGELPLLECPEGWFLLVERLPQQPWPRPSHFYRVYCPDHATRTLQWKQDLRDWKKERGEAGRAASKRLTLVDRAKALIHAAIGVEVRTWEEDHPRPKPPWKVLEEG